MTDHRTDDPAALALSMQSVSSWAAADRQPATPVTFASKTTPVTFASKTTPVTFASKTTPVTFASETTVRPARRLGSFGSDAADIRMTGDAGNAVPPREPHGAR